MPKRFFLVLITLLFFFAPPAFAAGGAGGASAAQLMLWIVIILLAAKFASLVERIGQPPVLGELLVGVLLGNLILLGYDGFETIKRDPILAFLAQLGVVILLFQVGLETNVEEIRRVGARAFLVACIGVIVPFALGAIVVGPALLPGLSINAYLFLGATLTATSVGITARVFRDLGKLQTREAQIVIGAAVIDDVLGLIILAVVSAIATVGSVNAESVALIVLKATLFLAGSFYLGRRLAPRLNRLFSRIQSAEGMKFTLAIVFCLAMAYLAEQIGLAAIVGAFAAGIILDPVHFREFDSPRIVDDLRATIDDAEPRIKARVLSVMDRHAERHIDHLVAPLGHFLVPIFFVLTGMSVRVDVFFDAPIVLTALGITVAAFVGKIVSGIAAGNANKWIVGWGMVPRGEVGLIFAATGKSLGVVSDAIFSMLVIVIILTTMLTPPVLSYLLRRQK